MGDKASAKETMKRAGVPTIPGSDGLVNDVKEGIKLANEIGYPVILKATAGGGGRGMRVVWKDEDYEPAWDSARQEAAAAFGNAGSYIAEYVEDLRHTDILFIGDQFSTVRHLSERDCSIERLSQQIRTE